MCVCVYEKRVMGGGIAGYPVISNSDSRCAESLHENTKKAYVFVTAEAFMDEKVSTY